MAAVWWLNGAPAARIEVDGQPAALSLVVENGQITRIYAVANPQRLTRLNESPRAAANLSAGRSGGLRHR